VADFGGGNIANMLLSNYINYGLLGDELSIQSVDTLFNSLDIASMAVA
jgi:hypothetical protein